MPPVVHPVLMSCSKKGKLYLVLFLVKMFCSFFFVSSEWWNTSVRKTFGDFCPHPSLWSLLSTPSFTLLPSITNKTAITHLDENRVCVFFWNYTDFCVVVNLG